MRVRNPSKEKIMIAIILKSLSKKHGFGVVEELKFHPKRKWRSDWAIPEKKILIEYEGLMSAKSRHTSITGFSNDCEKYNQAQVEGWKVLRYTAMNYGDLNNDIENILTHAPK